MRAGLIGATGLIGEQVLTQLLADPECASVRVWARRGDGPSHPKLDWQTVDFDQLAEQADFSSLDSVFCCLGTTTAKAGRAGLEKVDLDYVVACARLARAAEVACFCVVSSVGASPSALAHYSRTKGRMETALRALEFPSLEIVRPSLLLGARSEHRPGEALAQKLAPALNCLLPGPLRRYQAIRAQDVAQAMIQLAHRAEPGSHARHLPLNA